MRAVLFVLLCGVAHSLVTPTALPTPAPTEETCSKDLIEEESKICQEHMLENLGETVVCHPCVCQHDDAKDCPKPKKGVRWSHFCEAKKTFDDKDIYNCAMAPDREKCIQSVADCAESMSSRSNSTRNFNVCDNCVCRDVEGLGNCAAIDDCVAICNPEDGCDPLTDADYSYDCVAPGCGKKIGACFKKMNDPENLGKPVDCDNCVCENSHHFCNGATTCQMTCHDPKGCHSFYDSGHVNYGCASAPAKKEGSKVGLAVGMTALIAAVGFGAVFVYYKRSIAPRLSRIPGNDLLDEALVSDAEMKAVGSVGSTNNAVQGVGQSDYNEL